VTEQKDLSLTDSLPLTCSRSGTCCYGKAVWINPWELAVLAKTKGVSSREFRNTFCDFGGIRLKFNGNNNNKQFSHCNLYVPEFGCSVHAGRPLACRLFPLGLKRQGEKRNYIFNGTEFPCLAECPEVMSLPFMNVESYIEGQNSSAGVSAQDHYLTFMETLADGAFALLLDSGLAESGDRSTLKLWRTMGDESASQLARRVGSKWIDRLMIPEISASLSPEQFVQKHHELFQEVAQKSFGSQTSFTAIRDSAVLMMGLSLHLGRALGVNPSDLAVQWIATAKENGALE